MQRREKKTDLPLKNEIACASSSCVRLRKTSIDCIWSTLNVSGIFALFIAEHVDGDDGAWSGTNTWQKMDILWVTWQEARLTFTQQYDKILLQTKALEYDTKVRYKVVKCKKSTFQPLHNN